MPSPFVGAASGRAMAAAVPDAIAVDYGGVAGPDWYAGAAARIAAQADAGEPWIAVLHSGAGGFAPALATAAARLAGFIFVDAVLPYPGRSWRDTAPELADHLAGLTTGGVLPTWNQWFGRDPTPALLPDAVTRDAFVAGLPRVPLAFLEAVSPDLREWLALPVAYLQLSTGYDAESAEVERRGWPVRRAALHHLAMVSDPAKVAALLSELPMSSPNA